MDSNGKFIQKGDLIQFDSDRYNHWGVYDGEGYIIHVIGQVREGGSSDCDVCEAIKGNVDAQVLRENLALVAGKRKFYQNNLLDSKKKPYSRTEIINRARQYLGQGVKYSLLGFNCEHFVTWCRYGQAVSMQAETAVATMATVGGAAAASLIGGSIISVTK